MSEKKIQELTELANSKGPDGSYDISDAALDKLAATPEGKEAARRAREQRKG